MFPEELGFANTGCQSAEGVWISGGFVGHVGLRRVAGHLHYDKATSRRWLREESSSGKLTPSDRAFSAFLSSNGEMLPGERGGREV